MQTYETVTEALQALQLQGFTLDFNLDTHNIYSAGTDLRLHPDQFEIVQVHRFEGQSDQEDEEVLYAIQSTDGQHKGTLLSAYGTYADSASEALLKKLSIHL